MKERAYFTAVKLLTIATILAIFYTSCAGAEPTPTPERVGVLAVTATVDVADYVARQVKVLEANETQVVVNRTATIRFDILIAKMEEVTSASAAIQATWLAIPATVAPIPTSTPQAPIPPSPLVIPFDMNTATQASLLRLNGHIKDETGTPCGIGEVTAEAIAAFIAVNGPIKTLDELEPVRLFTIGPPKPPSLKPSTAWCLAPFTVQPAS